VTSEDILEIYAIFKKRESRIIVSGDRATVFINNVPVVQVKRGKRGNTYRKIGPIDDMDFKLLKRRLRHIFKAYDWWLENGKPATITAVHTIKKIMKRGAPP